MSKTLTCFTVRLFWEIVIYDDCEKSTVMGAVELIMRVFGIGATFRNI